MLCRAVVVAVAPGPGPVLFRVVGDREDAARARPRPAAGLRIVLDPRARRDPIPPAPHVLERVSGRLLDCAARDIVRRGSLLETVTQGFQAATERLRGVKELNEENIDEALRDVRSSLLEADVDFEVVRDFLARVKERALGAQGRDPRTRRLRAQAAGLPRPAVRQDLPEGAGLPDGAGRPVARQGAGGHFGDARWGSRASARRPWPRSSRATCRSGASARCSSRRTSTGRRPSSSSRPWARSIDVPVHRGAAGPAAPGDLPGGRRARPERAPERHHLRHGRSPGGGRRADDRARGDRRHRRARQHVARLRRADGPRRGERGAGLQASGSTSTASS